MTIIIAVLAIWGAGALLLAWSLCKAAVNGDRIVGGGGE